MTSPLRNKLARFASKPLPGKFVEIKETFRSVLHDVPFPLKRNIHTYLENRCKKRLFGVLAPLVPPVEAMFDGPPGLEIFKANGEEFLELYVGICGLRPDEKMLDVGCGIGRKTVPLTQYLTESATYEGIDITHAGVEWCRKTITPRFPNFRFQHIDVYNTHYNPRGKYLPSVYKFPFIDGSFDFVVLGSVFTHMLPGDVSNYLLEVHRVLRRGGRCLITYFLINEESWQLIQGNKSTIDFKYEHDGYHAASNEIPELAVALDERWITNLYQRTGLRIKRLDYGAWCGREKYSTYQDIILGVKE